MTFKVLLFAHRKPGSTPTEFRNYLESTHISLLKQLFSTTFPISHVRRYIHREKVDSEGLYPATVLAGSQPDFDCDVISELTFEDEKAFHAFFSKYQSEEIAAIIKEDEEHFLDAGKLKAVVIGEVQETLRQGHDGP